MGRRGLTHVSLWVVMTIVFKDNLFVEHDTQISGPHPESPRRLSAIDEVLARSDVLAKAKLAASRAPDLAWLTEVHSVGQIERARILAEKGGGHLDPDTALSQRSYDVALKAAGTACAAVDEVLSGRHKNALCLIRPPGHHATQDRSMGFCLFNNVAVAARYAQEHCGVGRILIVDWDVHHGNGTQDIFYDSDSVTFFSIHRFPFYPGTGDATETGTGAGLGATVNVPVPYGTPRAKYLDLFRAGLDRAAKRARPDLILISAGFDAHQDDPVGNLGLETDDYAALTSIVQDAADAYAKGKVVSCLEGGYDLEALGASVETHLAQLLAAETSPA